MKKLLLFLSFSLMLVPLKSENRRNDKTDVSSSTPTISFPMLKVKNDISGQRWGYDTIVVYDINNLPRLRTIKVYDKNGNTLSHIDENYQSFKNINWSYLNRRIYTYDDKNRQTTSYNDPHREYSTYVYDDENRTKMFTKYNGTHESGFTPSFGTLYTFDTRGNVIEQTGFQGSHLEPLGTTFYSYNNVDSLVYQVSYSSENGSVSDSIHYTYNNSNKLTEVKKWVWLWYNNERVNTERTICRYDEESKLIKQKIKISKDAESKPSIYSNYFTIEDFIYDDNNNLIENSLIKYNYDISILNPNLPIDPFNYNLVDEAYLHLYYSATPEIKTFYLYEYDSSGNLISDSHFQTMYHEPWDEDDDGEYTMFFERNTYEYDQQGNIIIHMVEDNFEWNEETEEFESFSAKRYFFEYDDFSNAIAASYEFARKERDNNGGVVSVKRRAPRKTNDDFEWEKSTGFLPVIIGGINEGTVNATGMRYEAGFVDLDNITFPNPREGMESAAYFDGHTAIRTSVNPPAFATTLTLAAWMKFDDFDSERTIASWHCGENNKAFFRTEGNKLVFRIWDQDSNSGKNITSTQELQTNIWYHAAVVLNEGIATLYINGRNVTPENSTLFNEMGNTVTFTLGSSPDVNADMHKGCIDNLTLWSVAKSSSEIADLMRDEITGNEEHLLLAMLFDENINILPETSNIVFTSNEPTYRLLDFYSLKSDGTAGLVPDIPAPFGNSFTISGWFKPEAGAERTIASWATSDSGDVGNFFRLENDNKLHYGQWNGAFNKASGAKALDNDRWYHLAMVKDNNAVKFYIDGEADLVTNPIVDNNSPGDNFNIGRMHQNNETKEHWKGEMDNLRFYTSAQTAAEIADEYSTVAGIDAETLWAAWNFDYRNGVVVDRKNRNHLHGENLNFKKSILVTTSTSFTDLKMEPLKNYEVSVAGKGTEFYINKDFIENTLTIHPGAGVTFNPIKLFSPAGLTLKNSHDGLATLVAYVSPWATIEIKTDIYRSWYIGIPMVASDPINLTGIDELFIFDEETDQWNEHWGLEDNTLTWHNSHKGVLLNPTIGSDMISLNGFLENDEVSTYNMWAENRRFQFIANPYPSFLKWSELKEEAFEVENTIWFRTVKNGEYTFATFNGNEGSMGGDDNIAPMQGFWVRINEDSELGNVNFSNHMRRHAPTEGSKLLRSPKAEYPVVRLEITDGKLTDETVIYFKEENSNGKDKYDAVKMMNNNNVPEIWTLINGEATVINAMQTIPFDEEMPLGFNTNKADNFTISINKFNGFDDGVQLQLIDKENGATTDLTTGSYSFSSDKIKTNDRFAIRFVPADITSVSGTNNFPVSVYSHNKTVFVHTEYPDNARAALYSISGQLISNQQLYNTTTRISTGLSEGVYFVVIENGKEKVTQRVIVR